MTRDEAISIRSAQLRGDPVTPLQLSEAVHVLSKRRDRRMVIPPLPRPVKEFANAALCFNLGLAIGNAKKG